MKTAIVFYSQHHKNTKKLVDAIKGAGPEVKLIDVSITKVTELDGYDRIGIVSGIYYSKFAKPLMEYLATHLPEGKGVFTLYTCGQMRASYTKDVQALVEEKEGTYLGEYGCLGFYTFGPFKLVGGLQKGHPTEEEIQGAVAESTKQCVKAYKRFVEDYPDYQVDVKLCAFTSSEMEKAKKEFDIQMEN